MNDRLTLGFSPCPNDTFIFCGLVHGRVACPGVGFAEPQLEDVETLNLLAMEKRLDVTKLSCHALGYVLDEYCVLSAGSALGRGCGPLLVGRDHLSVDTLPGGARIAIPGRYTTAALLLRMFLPESVRLVEMRFDRIMPALVAGEVDGGVIIHESRFTYQQHGLVCLQDLGQWWEQVSGLPIPLGAIAARRSLGRERLAVIEEALRQSVDYASASPAACMEYIRKHSQELEEEVVREHIGLYVNDYSRDLGKEGFAAIEVFLARGREAGVLPVCSQPLGYA